MKGVMIALTQLNDERVKWIARINAEALNTVVVFIQRNALVLLTKINNCVRLCILNAA